MTFDRQKTFPLDWRPELKKLEPFFAGKGGVVRIWYEGRDCAPHRFNAILKERYQKSDNGLWTSIRIDPEWHTTHLLEDVLHEFERKLREVGFIEENGQQLAMPPVSVLSDNDIDGNADISIESSIIGSYVESGNSPMRRDKKISAICNSLKQFLIDNGHFMIVMNHASPGRQSYFWRLMWRGGLDRLTQRGLLLIHFVDRAEEANIHPDAPVEELSLHLPKALLGDDSRQDDVYDDLIDIFEALGHDRDSAAMGARVHLQNNLEKISDLHDKLITVLLTNHNCDEP